jgi:hypothetical protein
MIYAELNRQLRTNAELMDGDSFSVGIPVRNWHGDFCPEPNSYEAMIMTLLNEWTVAVRQTKYAKYYDIANPEYDAVCENPQIWIWFNSPEYDFKEYTDSDYPNASTPELTSGTSGAPPVTSGATLQY